jgi:hypothetical protein
MVVTLSSRATNVDGDHCSGMVLPPMFPRYVMTRFTLLLSMIFLLVVRHSTAPAAARQGTDPDRYGGDRQGYGAPFEQGIADLE